MAQPTRDGVSPDGIPHYSPDPEHPVYFYKGWASNFDRQHPLYLPPPVAPPLVAFADVPLYYASGEHWLHCNKARTWQEHEHIRRAATPFEAKERGGRRSLPLDAEEVARWDERRYERMVVGLRAKTAQNRGVLRALVATGERLVAEVSPVDDVWGLFAPTGEKTGQNLLGKAWMQVRTELSS